MKRRGLLILFRDHGAGKWQGRPKYIQIKTFSEENLQPKIGISSSPALSPLMAELSNGVRIEPWI
jgi:hypothetical protein